MEHIEKSIDNSKTVENDTPALPTDEKKTVAVRCNLQQGWSSPEFKVSGVFSSHMVLQREQPIAVWGFSDTPGSRIRGNFDGEYAETTAANDNKWCLTFLPRQWSREGKCMLITDDRGHEVVFEDILIGDVWLIGGQSNAELTMRPCMTHTPEYEINENECIRLFTQTQAYVYNHQDFCLFPQPDIINPDWCWKRPDREAVMAFSAMGFYFAREVSKQIDIPLGMIMMAAGGACVRELLPEEIAHAEGYTYGANVRESGYYNTLIHPFLGLKSKGMLFFQGESEGGNRTLAEKYANEIALLVADERHRFGYDFPFYNVQLSDYREEGAQCFRWLDMIRIKQFEALQAIPDSTLTVDMDLGSPAGYPDWAHSPRKLELGERLAKLVLAREYNIGCESEVSSPKPMEAALSEDKTNITIKFTNVSGGLAIAGKLPADSVGLEVHGFSVGDYDHRTPAHAVITSADTVKVNVPEGADLSAVNYAYFSVVTPENANLRGGNKLPVPAFSVKLS